MKIEDPEFVGAGNEQQQGDPWHCMQVSKVSNYLGTDVSAGLSPEDAAKRLEEYGPNELSEKRKVTIWERIWKQINNILVFILIVVAVISAVKAGTSTGEDAITGWVEVVLIIGVIVLNTIIGIRQEGSAEKSAEALKAMLSSSATVIRSGEKQEIPARDVVPGDLVVLSTGDRIPADIRLVRVTNLACQEAALTGESVPVEKQSREIEAANPSSVPLGDRKNLAFSATLVSQGEAVGIVVATGDNTEIGQINSLVGKQAAKKTNVLVQIDLVSKFIAAFVVIVAIATFLVAYLQSGMTPMDAVNTALVTSVAMIPEGLAAIVTLTYAYAVSNMAKHNAIVRVLPAVETLGSVTVVCSDKTGTLTKNEMTMVALVTSNARYKFDTEAADRTPTNFTREDSFMAHDRNALVANESNEKSFQIVMEPHESDAASRSFVRNESTRESEGGPVCNGECPSLDFVRQVLAGGVLCSNATLGMNGGREGEIGNPTELAIVRAAYFGNCDLPAMKKQQPVIASVPFSSEYKFMATVHQPNPDIDANDNIVVHVKGAPDRLIALSSSQAKAGLVSDVEPIDRDYWLKQAANLSQHGLRVLALCRAEIPRDECPAQDEGLSQEFVNGRGGPWLTIVGLCAIMDPPRPECIDAIKVAHGAGVRVAMITGDHHETALAIGDMLGIVDREHRDAITGPQLDAMSDEELRTAVMKYNVFARASPENKIRIVKALQAEKQVCSMTGDGVNDAPALKAADMGVAMGLEGTDVAREAAEMILADDNFATIVTAVREGRVVWDNLRKVLLFNTPVNNAQGLTVMFGMITGLIDSPLTPIQVLYCNLICAVTLGMVLAVEPAEDGIMRNAPRRVGKRLIGRFLLLRIIIATIVLVATTVGAVWIVINLGAQDPTLGYGLNEQRSQASNTLTFGAIAVCLSARFTYNSSFHPRLLRGNKYVWYAVGLTTLLQICITYIPGLNNIVFSMAPMDGIQWGLTFAGMAITFITMEIEKGVRRSLKSSGFDTDDQEQEEEDIDMPISAAKQDSCAALHSTLLHK